jgi:glycosyltransferase involved in cell wall biosynthesis
MRTCVHILKSAQPECSGIARIVADFAKRSEPHGYRTTVLFLGSGPLVNELSQAGIQTASVSWTGYRSDPAGMWRVWRWLRAQRAEIAHLHHGAQSHRMLCHMAGAKAVVQHVHGQILEPALNPVSDLSFRGADAVIAVSRAVAQCLRGCDPEVIYSGIETGPAPSDAPSPSGPLRLGVLSRLIPLKNIEAAIEAAARLKDTGVDVQIDIAGVGPSENALRELASTLSVADRVSFLGWQPDVLPLLSSWHILLIPSKHEGLPRAALEAMAARRAVFASRVGGLGELVVDGVTGRLFTAGDTAEMVRCIADADKDRQRLADMGREGRERVRTLFSPDRMTERIATLYDGLLKRGR